MFKDELKSKFEIADGVFPFTLTMLARTRLVVSGIRSVVSSDDDRIKLRLRRETLTVRGEGLKIVEIDGGDIFISGEIGGLEFEK